jgi:ribosome-binding protein aMBF1 (putative translation factor)
MRTKIDKNILSKLPTVEEFLSMKYGVVGTPEREDFDAKSKAWYYATVLKSARKTAGITQQQLADRIGKKREYIALLEKGETDMQLSTFLMITEVLGVKLSLSY